MTNPQFIYQALKALSYLLKALLNCENFTVITILYNDVLTWN